MVSNDRIYRRPIRLKLKGPLAAKKGIPFGCDSAHTNWNRMQNFLFEMTYRTRAFAPP